MIKSLSYVGFSSPDAQAWRTFAPDILGLEVVSSADDDVVRPSMSGANVRHACASGDENPT